MERVGRTANQRRTWSCCWGWPGVSHRNALAAKCDGLNDNQLIAMSARAVPNLSLPRPPLRHLTEMEYYYPRPTAIPPVVRPTPVYCTEDDEDGGHPRPDTGHGCPVDGALAGRMPQRRRRTPRSSSNSTRAKRPGNGFSVRWNLIKIIQEYAPPTNGHADLLPGANRRRDPANERPSLVASAG